MRELKIMDVLCFLDGQRPMAVSGRKNLNFGLKVVKSKIKDADTKSIVLAGLEEDSWP